jgi:hypothetical protein
MKNRNVVVFLVLLLAANAQAQKAARDGQADAVRNAQADAAARDADGEVETLL